MHYVEAGCVFDLPNRVQCQHRNSADALLLESRGQNLHCIKTTVLLMLKKIL